MSTAQSFIDQMNKAGKEASSGGAGIVAQATVEFGWHRYVEGVDFHAPFTPVKDPDDMLDAKQRCVDFLRENGSQDWPTFGVRTTVHKEEILTGEKRSYAGDLREFVASFQEGAYEIVMQSLADTECPVGSKFWGRVKSKNDPYAVEKGEDGKTDKDQNGNPAYPRIRYIAEAFSNRAEALAVTGADDIASPHELASALVLSATATIAKWTLDSLQNEAENLHKLVAGKPVKVVENVLAEWGLEQSDLKLINIEIPF